MKGLVGRVAIVTGAAGGIGSAICRRLADEQVRIAAVDISAPALKALADSLRLDDQHFLPMDIDITNYDAVNRAAQTVVRHFGKVDILINNAGWDVPKLFLDSDPDFWEKVISINLVGALNMHKAVLPHIISNGGGKVINIASDAARVGSSGESVYSACKGGLISFTKTLARECARQNVRLNVVCPGPTDTPLLKSFLGEGEYGQKLYEGLKRAIPLKRLGQPDDLPGIIAFMASEDANFITGQVISVSGGLTMNG